jgi:hypothetical protein
MGCKEFMFPMVFNDHPFLLALNNPPPPGGLPLCTQFMCAELRSQQSPIIWLKCFWIMHIREKANCMIKLGIWRQKLGGTRMPTLATGMMFKTFAKSHHFSSWIWCNVYMLAYNCSCRSSHMRDNHNCFSQTIFEFTCRAITFYNTMLRIFIYVREGCKSWSIFYPTLILLQCIYIFTLTRGQCKYLSNTLTQPLVIVLGIISVNTKIVCKVTLSLSLFEHLMHKVQD